MRGEEIIQRATATEVVCPYCGARPGDPCFDPKTGYVLEKQPAHVRRLWEAGVL